MNIGVIFKPMKDEGLSVCAVGTAIQVSLCLVILGGHLVYANTPICKAIGTNTGWGWEDGGTCIIQTHPEEKAVATTSISALNSPIQLFEDTDVDPFQNSAVLPFEDTVIEPFENTSIEPFEDTAIEPFENTIVAFRNTINSFENTSIEPFKNTAVQPFEDTDIEPFEETILSRR